MSRWDRCLFLTRGIYEEIDKKAETEEYKEVVKETCLMYHKLNHNNSFLSNMHTLLIKVDLQLHNTMTEFILKLYNFGCQYKNTEIRKSNTGVKMQHTAHGVV